MMLANETARTNPNMAVVFIVMTIVSVIFTITLVIFILACKTKEKKCFQEKLKVAFYPINVCLLLMSLSQISMCAAEALYYLSTNNEVTVNTGIVVQNAKLMNAARSWSATTFKITYLEYSYFRTAPILKQAYSDFANPALIAVHVSALFLTLPSFYVTSALWYTMDSNQIAIRNYIALATFVWLLLIDSCFLALFVKCLRSYKDLVEVDSQFLIISRFGIVAGILFCCVIPFTYLYMFFGSEYYYCVCIFLFSTIFIVLFGMKISLHRDTLRKQKELRERINAAKQNTTIGAGRCVFKSQDTMAFDDDNKV